MDSTQRLKELLSMAGSNKAKKLIKQKSHDRKCLQCDLPANPKRRGLCTYHYNQFVNAKAKQPQNKRKAFDKQQVLEGKILESKPGRTPISENPFLKQA